LMLLMRSCGGGRGERGGGRGERVRLVSLALLW
jgi:hypothetical protein